MVAIFGTGWLGKALALHLKNTDEKVFGSYRRPEVKTALEKAGVSTFSFEDTLVLKNCEFLVFCIPPGFRKNEISEVLKQHASVFTKLFQIPKKIIFISSTSVYPKDQGTYTEPQAQEDSPVFLLEDLAKTMANDYNKEICVLRLGGLMGYGREACNYLNKNSDNLNHTVNYVFRDDVIRAIETMLPNFKSGTFNIVSNQHPTRKQILEKRCQELESENNTLTVNRIIDNTSFKNTFSFEYLFPDPIYFPKC